MSQIDKNFEALIEKKEAELSPYYIQMEQLRLNFIRETVSFAKEQYKNIAKEYVSKNSDHILSMGTEQLIQMKNKIKNLIANTENTVKSIMDNTTLWWHLRPSSKDPINLYLQIDNKYPTILDQAVRQVLGRLGEILQEYRFHITVTGNHGSFYEYWYTIAPIGGAAIPCYPHLLEWSTELQNVTQQYNICYMKAKAIYKEMDLLREQKKREEALLRWDSF